MHPTLKKGVKGERWGEPFQDRRDWKLYNRQLVGRGQMLIHPTFFKKWSDELDTMNQGKEGGPFEVPDSFIQYLAFVRTRARLDYRTLQGFAQGLIENVKPGLRVWGMTDEQLARLKAPSFSQIRRRMVRLKIDPKDVSLLEKDQEVYLLLDATGVKVTNRGEWIRQHGSAGQSRGWLKLHLGIDKNHKQTATLIVTTDAVGDVRKGPELIRRTAKAIRDRGANPTRDYGDGAYDSRADFDESKRQGLRPVIKPRTNSYANAHGSLERKRRVIEFQRLGYKDWAGYLDYGIRWLIEAKIGAVKRTMGEYVAAKAWWPMVREAKYKFWAHDAMLYHDHTGQSPWERPA
ncbi:MAG: IS5 family transposase [Actinobacteria bacterium]|nr:IS5 family transposase [Actinomycetota bacterium]